MNLFRILRVAIPLNIFLTMINKKKNTRSIQCIKYTITINLQLVSYYNSFF